jgi:hypothetical protein
MLRAYYEEKAEIEQSEWERTRWQAYIIVSACGNYKKGFAPKSPKDLGEFHWETRKKSLQRKLTKEEAEKQKEEIKKAFG